MALAFCWRYSPFATLDMFPVLFYAFLFEKLSNQWHDAGAQRSTNFWTFLYTLQV